MSFKIEEPRKYTVVKTLNSTDPFDLRFEGEDWGDGIKDTRVTMPNGSTLCWIVWDDNENFMKDLKNVIDKYRI